MTAWKPLIPSLTQSPVTGAKAPGRASSVRRNLINARGAKPVHVSGVMARGRLSSHERH